MVGPQRVDHVVALAGDAHLDDLGTGVGGAAGDVAAQRVERAVCGSAVDIARAACTTSTVPPTSSAGSVASLPSAATPTAWKNVIWRGLSAVNIG